MDGADPRIKIGDPRENPTLLTRQDWRLLAEAAPGLGGCWELDVARTGRYEITLHVQKGTKPATSHVGAQRQGLDQPVPTARDSGLPRGRTHRGPCPTPHLAGGGPAGPSGKRRESRVDWRQLNPFLSLHLPASHPILIHGKDPTALRRRARRAFA